jgi:DNA-binding NtrC family response regulator
VRELSNTVERALLLLHGAVITPNSVAPLPVAAAPVPLGDVVMVRYSFAGTVEEERARIQDALSACRGNKTRAAASLGMSRNTLLNKLRTINCG